MKILGGRLKGRVVKSPNVYTTRSITACLLKSIFDSCQFFIEDSIVCDLFAGSGIIGMEALSRGARLSYFVDINPIAIKSIKENLKNLNLEQQSKVFIGDSFDLLLKLNIKFDILFLDPPYTVGESGYFNLLILVDNYLKTHRDNCHIYLEAPSQLANSIEKFIPSMCKLIKIKKSSTTTLFHFSS